MAKPRESEGWKVGVLFSATGATSVIEKTQQQGTLLAIEEINAAGGVRGLPIRPVILDPASTPQRYARLADRMLAEEEVSVIFGCYMSSTRKAVLPVVERRGGLLCYPTLYEGFEYSPNVIYSGAAPNQNSLQLARYLLDRVGRNFYFIGSNYVFPYESNRIMADLVHEQKGKVIAERYLPLGASPQDFAKVVADIAELKPDVIFSTVVGEDTAKLYGAYHDAGLDPWTMPIASLTTSEAEVAMMGAAAGCGHIAAAPYFSTVDSEANRRFVRNYAARFGIGALTNACCEAAYFQTHIVARALDLSGDMAIEALLPAIKSIAFEAPQGLVRIDPDNNHAHLWPRIGRVGANGQFDILEEASAAEWPDPYLVQHSLEDWTVVGRVHSENRR